MGRRRKDPASNPERIIDDSEQAQLSEVLAEQQQSGTSVPAFKYRIWRRPAGTWRWTQWKVGLAPEEIGNMAEFCHKDGGEGWDYRATLYDINGARARTKEGTFIPEEFIAAKTLPNQTTTTPSNGQPTSMSDEAMLASKRQKNLLDAQMIMEKQRELENEREKRKLAAEELEMKRQENVRRRRGEDDDDLEDDPDNDRPRQFPRPPQFMRPGPRFAPAFYPGYNPYAPPPEPKDDRMFEMMMAQMQQNTAIITAAMGHKGNDSMKDILPLIMGHQMTPDKMFGMFAPLLGEMTKMQGAGMKSAMEAMTEMQTSVLGKIVDSMIADNRPQDEIDKVQRIAGLVTDGIQELTKTVLGRESIFKPGTEVKVPVIGKTGTPTPQLKNVPRGTSAPAQKAPAPSPETLVNPAAPTPASHPPPVSDTGEPAPPPPPPVNERRKAVDHIMKTRISGFLAVHEQEMLGLSDPGLVVEKVEELYLSLPKPLRDRIEALEEPSDIYDEFKKHDPEAVLRILTAAKESKDMAEWCVEFWNLMLDVEPAAGNESEDREVEPAEPEPVSEEK